MNEFNGLGLGPHNLSWLSGARTRSISAENATGEKGKGGMATEGTGAGAARDLGRGWRWTCCGKTYGGEWVQDETTVRLRALPDKETDAKKSAAGTPAATGAPVPPQPVKTP